MSASSDFVPYPDPGAARASCVRASVSAIVFDERGRVLLQQRADNGHWGLPGGGVDPGESVAAAVQREVREETGYLVEVVRLIGVYSDPAHHQIVRYPDGNVVHYVSCALECHVVGGAPATDLASTGGETLALDWCHLDELPQPFVPSHRLRLQDAKARSEAAFVR